MFIDITRFNHAASIARAQAYQWEVNTRRHKTVLALHNSKTVKDIWHTILLAWNISEALIWITNMKYEQ